MNKKALKSPLKILAATSVTIFSLLSVFTSTAAWFDSQRNLKNGANEMAITTTHNLKEIRIYSSSLASIEDGYVFNQTPIQTITTSSTIPSADDEWKYQEGSSSAVPYTSADPVTMNPQIVDPTDSSGTHMVDDPFSPLNPYHPLLMVIEYKEPISVTAEEGLSVKMETDHRFLAPARSSYAKDSDDLTADIETISNDSKFPLSSLVHTYSSSYSDIDDVPYSYYFDDDQEKVGRTDVGGLEHGSFASIATKNNVVFPIFDQHPTIFTADVGDEVACVAIILEYYIEVIEYIYSYYVGLPALELNHDTYCDWRMLV